MQAKFYPRLLRLNIVPIFIVAALVLANVNQYSFAQESSVALEVDGVTYDIPYSTQKSKIVNATADWEKRTLIFHFDPPANGIVMQLPRDVVDQMANINVLLIMDDNNKPTEYKEEKVDCDTRTISVNFKNDVSSMQIIGSFLRSPNEPKPDANLELDVDGKLFKLTTSSDSRVCDWRFMKDERKLEIDIQGGSHLQVITANELIGRPYTVLADGKSVDFKMHNASDFYSSISTKYENASTISIIGTTGIPEFPISVLVAALGMVSTITLLQLRKVRLNSI
ncbi:MAG: hypothetical protein HMLIMOIP_000714 [Candidatus Nitrosomirales archaeon]|jgi:hypothetical protein